VNDLKVRALKSFAGKVTMAVGEVREIKDEVILKDLLRAEYVETVEEPKKSKKKVKTYEVQ
jgi:hypothetical protein